MTSATATLSTIRKPLLSETVYDRLLASVISGELPPGKRLNIDELAATFGVSRTPIREALTRLSHARLLEVSRNASTTVANWGLDDMRARAQMLGAIARGALLSAPPPSAETISVSSVVPATFVHVCCAIVEPLGTPLTVQVAAELAAPLKLFLAPEVLTAHGVLVATNRFLPALDHLIAMLDTGSQSKAAVAVDRLTLAFTEQLSA